MRMSSSYGLKGNLPYHSCFFYAAESEDFTMKLTYYQNGDYLLPDLGLTEAEQRPLGKYGRMRLRYLCLLYTSPSPRDRLTSRMPSSA